jgi:hypothetical protein
MYENERSGFLPEMATFISLGLNINAQNNDGETPLLNHISCAKRDHGIFKRLSVIEKFLEMGADIFTQNNGGETILHVIAGVSLAERDEFYNFPSRYEMIEENEKEGAFKYFMAKGLDPFKEDNRQRTPVVRIPFLSLSQIETCDPLLIMVLVGRCGRIWQGGDTGPISKGEGDAIEGGWIALSCRDFRCALRDCISQHAAIPVVTFTTPMFCKYRHHLGIYTTCAQIYLEGPWTHHRLHSIAGRNAG